MSRIISDLESEIRDYINSPRNLYLLTQNDVNWNILCSALDVIGDIELGINAYLSEEWSTSDGAKYLFIYGILQMLYVQQDVILEVNSVFELSDIKEPELISIRELRNKSIGHPAKRGKKRDKKSSHFIARYSISKEGFQLMSVYEKNPTPEFIYVNIISLIEEQHSLLVNILEKIMKKLKEKEMTHKQEFQDIKLENIIKSLTYPIQKIFEASPEKSDLVRAKIHLDEVKIGLISFKDELEKRELLLAYDSLNYHLSLVDYPVERLEQYFSEKTILSPEDVYIYTVFIQKQISELKPIAREIDEDYLLRSTRPA